MGIVTKRACYTKTSTVPESGVGSSKGKKSEQLSSFQFSLVQFSPLTDWVSGGHEGQFRRDPLSVFSAGGYCEQFWHRKRCPLFDVEIKCE